MEEQNNQLFEIIRCLVVDVDVTCLLITATFLKKSKFEVVTVKSAKDALGVLRGSGLSFDLVVTEVHMPEMNGFQLQQEIAKEFIIPVAFLSADEKESTIMKGLESSGVILFMGKPISQNNINYLWNYATVGKKNHKGKHVINQQNQDNTNERIPHEVIHIESSSSNSERDKSVRKCEETESEQSSSPPSKKSRVVWTDPLHDKFVEVVSKLGMKKAHPRKILDLMDTPELTRIHVASHLQKYRMGLEKNNSSELVSDVSKITFSNANELSTRKATDNISTRAQQLMIENLNFVDHAIEVDHQVSQFSQREKELARILCRHVNQKSHHIGFGEASVELSTLQESYESTRNGGTSTTVDGFAMLENVYSIPHSTELTPIISGSQLNVQSSNMQENYEGITSEKRPFDLRNVLPNSEPEQSNYNDITSNERSFSFCNVLSSSEPQQGDYGCFTAEDSSFLHSIFHKDLEQQNYTCIAAEDRPLHLHNVPLNSEFEQENYIDFTTERSFQLHYSPLNPEVEEKNYDVITEEISSQHQYLSPNLEFEQNNYGDITVDEILFKICDVLPNSEPQQDNHRGITTEEGSFQLNCNPSHPELEQNNHGDITVDKSPFNLCNSFVDLEPQL